jgi:hypothetical protein
MTSLMHLSRPGKRGGEYREHLMPPERRRLEALEQQMDDLSLQLRETRAKIDALRNTGNSRRMHALGKSTAARAKAAKAAAQ